MGEFHFARQAIFDKQLNVVAYELLYRGDNLEYANVTDGTMATSQLIINAFLDMDLEKAVGGNRAFINLNRELLISDKLYQLPKELVVLEVLEDVKPDKEVVDAIAHLVKLGFTVALDDFCYQPELQPMVNLAQLIKIDILQLTKEEVQDHAQQLKGQGKQLLAEKIETTEQFEYCKQLGFDFYQGYFISRPNIMKGRRPPSNRLLTLQLLNELQRPDASLQQLEEIIIRDVSFSYRVLRSVNSAMYNLPREVESIRTAVQLLGMSKLQHLASLVALSQIDDKPSELINIALIRAKMAELMCQDSGSNSPEIGFTVGLFSTLESLLDISMSEIISELALSEEIKNALLHQQGPLGELLTTIINYESGDWKALSQQQSHYSAAEVGEHYLTSISWADQVIAEVPR